MIDRIVSESIKNYIDDKMLLKEYKNPNDSDTIRVCTDQLENVYENILKNGGSKNEYTVMQLAKVIHDLRKIQDWFK